MKNKVTVLRVRVLVDVVDTLGVKGGGAAFYAMDLIAFFEEEFGKVRAVLAGDAGD